MITLNEKVQALIDLLNLYVEQHDTYATVYLDEEGNMSFDLHEKDDIQYVKKAMFNNLYSEGRHAYKWAFMEKLNDELDKHDSFIWKAVYDYKNPFE